MISLIKKYLIALALIAPLFAASASAQSTADFRYEIGLRSTVMLTGMPLSELGGGFVDLPAGGASLPHSSSLFILWPVGEHLRLGVETLVGNSYPKSNTAMLFQASGVVAEYQTSGTWFVAASLQAGGMLASANQSLDSGSEDDPLHTGDHYKNDGWFVAPQVGIGRLIGDYDIRLVAKQVRHLGDDGFNAFDSFYAGISVGLLRR